MKKARMVNRHYVVPSKMRTVRWAPEVAKYFPSGDMEHVMPYSVFC